MLTVHIKLKLIQVQICSLHGSHISSLGRASDIFHTHRFTPKCLNKKDKNINVPLSKKAHRTWDQTKKSQ